MKHVTNRTWTPDDLVYLGKMADQGVSAARAAVALRRSITAVKVQAKKIGHPFPDERVLKRERRAREQQAIGRWLLLNTTDLWQAVGWNVIAGSEFKRCRDVSKQQRLR